MKFTTKERDCVSKALSEKRDARVAEGKPVDIIASALQKVIMAPVDDLANKDWASPPGATMKDLMEERSISLAELAVYLDYTPTMTAWLLEGQEPITAALARDIALILGSTPEFWMNRQIQYTEAIKKKEEAEKKDAG